MHPAAGSKRTMNQAFHYRHSGLAIESVLELPEWSAFAARAMGAPDVVIRLGEGGPEFADDCEVTVRGSTLAFAIPGIGGWEVEGGQTIRIYPDPVADPAELRLFTLGSGWAALGYQRGFAMWHGSAVTRQGGAVMFCGPAGEGKSTLAAALVARGCSLVADDLSRVVPDKGAALIYPSSTRIKLWREAVERLDWTGRVIGRDWMREDKFTCTATAAASSAEPIPLIALVVLVEGEELRTERLSGADAVSAILNGTLYRPQILDALGGWAGQGTMAAKVASTTEIYRLTRPKDFTGLDMTCEAVERLFK